MISWGGMRLPNDLAIFLPRPSTTKPWVSTLLKGGFPSTHIAGIKEDWNHPRCWSEPSKYKAQGKSSSFLFFNTAWWLIPESNQTSQISSQRANLRPWHLGQANPSGKNAFISSLNQISLPA